MPGSLVEAQRGTVRGLWSKEGDQIPYKQLKDKGPASCKCSTKKQGQEVSGNGGAEGLKSARP